MITFILNDKEVTTSHKSGLTLLDFIRYEKDLVGTKIGCREGDCGACTVLEGRLEEDKLVYRSIVSCLTPLGNAHGKHIVTVEGLNMDKLSPVQSAMVEHNASQCGFCTPGFIVSLTGHTLEYLPSDEQSAIDSVNGNICRCTGYKSIERAAISISRMLSEKNPEQPLGWLTENGFLPAYFLSISERLKSMQLNLNKDPDFSSGGQIIGGGTDLMVQKPDDIAEASLNLFFDKKQMQGIRRKNGYMIIGASATANDIMHSSLMGEYIPEIKKHFRLVSSDPIRNMGTVGGNIVNASPIADLVIFFLALGTSLKLVKGRQTRNLPLEAFFLDYKKLDLQAGEYIEQLYIPLAKDRFGFNFEKVSKRTHLDIASVNSAIFVRTQEDLLVECRLSIGGVSPVPLFLKDTSSFLSGSRLSEATLREAMKIIEGEIAPISDVRGSKEYKRLLARQLFIAHFLKLFPERFVIEELIR
ncbi:MAG: FAD binding domain-containing protein [Bacteroidales bacterium]|nr:FAD binding domain-containing protein [Bacteroidales bacterium]